MKKTYVLGLGLAIGLMSCEQKDSLKSLDNQMDSLAYALGVDTSVNLPKSVEGINMSAFQAAMTREEGAELLMDDKCANEVIESYVTQKRKEMAEENQARLNAQQSGEEYVAPENSSEKAVFVAGDKVLSTRMDSVSYAIGVQVYDNMSRAFEELNFDVVNQAISQVTNGEELLIEESNCQNVIQQVMFSQRAEMMEKQRAEREKQMELEYADVKQAGLEFLAENAKRDGVIVTDSGLQYEVVKKGNEVYPNGESNVTVHYVGTTPEGEVFDSSRERGEPTSFGLNQVIRGWTEGVQLMGEGAIYKFYIPQELAYGASAPQGSPIKPLMPLVFEVELISVNQ